jgi:D-alanyl-D-alanine carboxypeptidase
LIAGAWEPRAIVTGVLDLGEVVARHGIVGAVAGVSHRGVRSVAAGGLAEAGGFAEAGGRVEAGGRGAAGREMTVDTPVRIASITKPIVATAVVLAARSELDQPVRDRLPQLHDRWRVSPRLTLRHLLSHTSGLRRVDPDQLRDAGDGDDALLTGAGVVVANGHAFQPGAAWQYCNPGFWLAGAVLADIGGVSFEEMLSRTVLTPAGMDRTGFELPDGSARGHRNGEIMDPAYARARRPSGGLWSTVDDLLSFAEFVTADADLVATVSRSVAWSGFGARYGVGFGVAGPAILHDGDFDGFRAGLVIVPAQRFAAVVVSNDHSGDRVRAEVLRRELKRATGLAPPWRAPIRYPAMAYSTARLLVAAGASRRRPLWTK